jgi:hypothetical protein
MVECLCLIFDSDEQFAHSFTNNAMELTRNLLLVTNGEPLVPHEDNCQDIANVHFLQDS